MAHKKIIENQRVELAESLRTIAPDFERLSIATGYWDLPGMQQVFDSIRGYQKVRLLIGQEPLSPRNSKLLKIEVPQPGFPDQDLAYDLTQLNDESLRTLVVQIKEMMAEERLEVRVYRKAFLHAKAYIFGDYDSDGAIGIIGSSNFTRAGLTTNTELNSLEDQYMVVKYRPQAETDQHGHLSWFDALWNDETTEKWDGKFTEILGHSPVGDVTYGPYDMYIKTLMDVYPDELIPAEELSAGVDDVLYTFQYRNAQLLINKLNRMGLAMLADSVGLGKTVTSGAVIKHYKDKGATRIYVIAPAGLKSQWIEDMAEHYDLFQGFEVLSLQDQAAIERARELDRYKSVDLFVVDEAHNLRNSTGVRHEQLLDWFIANPQSKVLMLTATPVNNSLMDFVNQIQLASKGSLESINVDYRNENGQLEKVDFFSALAAIQARITRAEKQGMPFDWDSIAPVVASGLRHYLVRMTRQGVQQMGGIVLSDGSRREFPESVVDQIGYEFGIQAREAANASLESNLGIYEGHDPRNLDLEQLLDQTQRSEHPLDSVAKGTLGTSTKYRENLFANLYQIVLLLGFTPYRPEIYQHRIHGKSIEDIKSLGLRGEEKKRIRIQLAIHNMLRITWLKRMESSQAALVKSVENYLQKLDRFENFINQGKILSFKDMENLVAEYGEDLEEVVIDWSNQGETRDADPDIYNLVALKNDLKRDRELASHLRSILLAMSGHDDKLASFIDYLNQISASDQPAHKKILVFSYFSDTINYLKSVLPDSVALDNFELRSAFVTGSERKVEQIARRFAPKAKRHQFRDGESELDFLFATDVLSEGQNLQDAGTLVNYDLHWNPVRMIQRNGRINRLGSEFQTVFISNMYPENSLEEYLKLIKRLNRKIDTIKHTIGLDQNVTARDQINAKNFVEQYEEKDVLELLQEEELGRQDEPPTTTVGIESLYGPDADKALEAIENREESFFAETDYVYDLRAFLTLNAENPQEIQRVRDIPLGKWGYLPYGQVINSTPAVLGLATTSGQTSITGTQVQDTFFVKVKTDSQDYIASYLEDSEALQLLRALPTDNENRRDAIDVDRKLVTRRVKSAAKAQADQGAQGYRPKRSEEEAILEFEKVLPGRNLLALISTRITNKKEEREFRRLGRQALSHIRNHGLLLPDAIKRMDELSIALSEKIVETTKVEEVLGVLFYAQQ